MNALWLGYVDTPPIRSQLQHSHVNDVIYLLAPQRRLLDPQEGAACAVLLASEQGRNLTGQAVVIDGGYLAQQGIPPVAVDQSARMSAMARGIPRYVRPSPAPKTPVATKAGPSRRNTWTVCSVGSTTQYSSTPCRP